MLERYRDDAERIFTPLARGFQAVGLTPNMLSAISLLMALLAGAAFYRSSPSANALLLLGALLVGVNAFLDGVDGHLARMTGQAGPRGDYLDHVIDRYADLAMITGITLSAWTTPIVGFFAIMGTLLTSYMGTQAQAVGVGRNYRGLLGRADRMGLLVAVPLAQWIVLQRAWTVPWGTNLMELLLLYIAVMGNITAIQRFVQGWSALDEET